MIIAFLAAFFLDNTVPGTREERGMQAWDRVKVRTGVVPGLANFNVSTFSSHGFCSFLFSTLM